MNNQNVGIENKLLAQDEFLKLDRLLNRFNVFEATDMVRREIKHTKFLCYLLNPNESHGLGETFIKRFVTLISEKNENFPNILNLDFSFAKITAEKKFPKDKSSLDCLIEIPLRGQSDKSIIIAIENKIDSKQGEKQLETYANKLEESIPGDGLFMFYLVFNDEEPKDIRWKVITYSNVVLPAVQYTIEILEDKGALHLKETLNDYLVLLLEDEDGDREKEQLANQLIQVDGVKGYLESHQNDKKLFGSIYIKHKKSIDYLCQLDQDPRTGTLNWWNKLKPIHYEFKHKDYASPLIFKYESSIRSYLMFSVLTESNRKNLTLLSGPTENWIDRISPISFQISLRLAYEKSENDQQEKSFIGVSCSVTLILGPLDNHVDRPELLNLLYPAFDSKLKPKDEGFKGRFNRLISTRKAMGKGKSEIVSKPIEWIENNILHINNNVIDIEQWIVDTAVKLNQVLDKYFESKKTNNV